MADADAAPGVADENPPELERMQEEWEGWFAGGFPGADIDIDIDWVGQMLGLGLTGPKDLPEGMNDPRSFGEVIAGMGQANKYWQGQQNRIATDWARQDMRNFGKLSPEFKAKYPKTDITYKDPNIAQKIGDGMRGMGNWFANLLPNTTEKVKENAKGGNTVQGALAKDVFGLLTGKNSKEKLAELLTKPYSELTTEEQALWLKGKEQNREDLLTSMTFDEKHRAQRDWVQQGRPEIYQDPQGGDAADNLDSMTKEMLQETGMRNYLNELSKTLPEAVGAISGGASDVMGGSAPYLIPKSEEASVLGSNFGPGPGFDRLGPDPRTIGIPTVANEQDFTGYMGQAQDLVGGPRFGPYNTGRPTPQDLGTFDPNYGQVDTTALMNMLKEIASQAPITPEPVVTPPPAAPVTPPPAAVITSPGPDSGPRDSIVTQPQVITDSSPAVTPDPVATAPVVAPTPVAPAPVITPLPPAPAPVASPRDEIVKMPQMLTDVPTPQTIEQQVLKELTENVVGNIIPAQPGGTFIPNPPEAGIDPVIEEAIKAYVEAPKGPMLKAEYLNTPTTATPLPIGININNAFPPAISPAMYEEIVKTAVAPAPVPIPTPAPAPVVVPTPLVTQPTVQPAVTPPSYVNRKNFIPTVSDLVNTRKAIGGSGVFQDTGRSFGGGGSTVKVDAPIYRYRH